MPVKEPALSEVKVAPFTAVGMNRWRTWPVAVLNTMIGCGDPMSSTAPLLVLLFGLSAIALARTAEPSCTILPAGVRV